MESALLVRDIMISDVKTARLDDTLREIVRKMVRSHIGSIVVVQEDRPVGIITERDVLVQLSQARLDLDVTRAKDIMSKPVLTIGVKHTIQEAAEFMTNNNIKKLPVTEGEKLVGIVTSTDIMRCARGFADLYEEMDGLWRQRKTE